MDKQKNRKLMGWLYSGGSESKKRPDSTLADDVLSQMLLDVPEPQLEPIPKKRRTEVIFEQMLTQEPTQESVPADDILETNVADQHIEDDHKLIDSRNCHSFYWYDIHEEKDIVYLFGKIPADSNKYATASVVIRNMKRTIYLLIAPDCSYDDVVAEFTHITAKRFKIKDFVCEKVMKNYAFSSDSRVPISADYVKVEYPCNQPTIPHDHNGETFTRILNSNQTPMEKLILDLKLRGPCWLRLIDPTEPVGPKMTHTKVELVLDSPDKLVIDEQAESLKTPYFSALALSLRVYTNQTSHTNEIVAIAGMMNTCMRLDECLSRKNKASGHFLLMSKPPITNKKLRIPYNFQAAMKKYNKTKFELFENERDMLTAFMDKFTSLDPDIVIGHELLSYDFETIMSRIKVNKVLGWSQLGRFPRSELPQTKTAFRHMFSGRIMCDIEISAKELIHAKSYDLTQLASQILDVQRKDYNYEELVEAYKTSDGLIGLLNATWDNTDYIFSILAELNVIPLALKITNITGGLLSRTLMGGRSERNDYLLLHAFHEENYICPERQVFTFKNKKGTVSSNGEASDQAPIRKKAAYSGGLVLEPKTGFYDSCILLMDFNSLYPSIIQEFNICFSTVKVPDQLPDSENTEIIASLPDENAPVGILPTQLKKLVDGRRRVKRQLAETSVASQKIMLDIEQKALKLTANSMYGCLGFEHCRFYAKHLASLVTFKGREILMSTKAMVEKLGYEVIYGDTDSLMINTKLMDYSEVINQGSIIKEKINRTFRLLEIDIDGVFKPLLLLKKKNYAGASIVKGSDGELVRKVETKGLDTVRRDRAVIAKDAGEQVLSMILAGDKDIIDIVADVHNFLKDLRASIDGGQLPPEKFLIRKQLNRNPEEYRETKGVGHVTLALRHNSNPKNTKKLRSGHTVEYVICLDDTDQTANQRAYTIAELNADPKLSIDTEYYLCQQIHPVMARICDKLPTTGAYTLAEMLGIEDKMHFRREDNVSTKRDQLVSKGDSRFSSCPPVEFKCPNCNLPTEISERFHIINNNKRELSLTNCPQCNSRYSMNHRHIVGQVIALIRRLTIQLYNSKYHCENPDCDYVTRNICGPFDNDISQTQEESRAQPICPRCSHSLVAELDDRQMDQQLLHMEHLFKAPTEEELSRFESRPKEDVLDMYNNCHKEVKYALNSSFINNIDATQMFKMVCSGTTICSANDADK